jgi:DNA-binding beta-propeller fold protein YncE
MMSFGVSSEENGNLLHPSNVAVDSEGDVYVVDFGNNRVQIYEPNGDIITALRGDGTEFSKWAKEVVDANPDVTKAFRRVKDLSPLGKFARPVGILVDDEDRVIISETVRSRLQVYEKEKNYMDPQFNL